ncbi:39S ribosomal protein L42, mitochondrial [Patagioenas fasciata monilis]|uniref:Large ribosomal subunit protein mL42 n=1 Tax=Patagioenas fasciata monilis TaxID=372326 RepID=A0A1V4KPV7_PATFA|nr:39S ribosomal protein L42, mitochondrial [Patagioenas fasciata monilis]
MCNLTWKASRRCSPVYEITGNVRDFPSNCRPGTRPSRRPAQLQLPACRGASRPGTGRTLGVIFGAVTVGGLLRGRDSGCRTEGVLQKKKKGYSVCSSSILSRTGFHSALTMATSLRTAWSTFFWMRSAVTCKQAPLQTGAVYHACHKSTYSVLPEDYNCKVELAVTSDLKTIVCYHPSLEIPYEHTKLVNCKDEINNNDDSSADFRDPVNNTEETLDQVLKSRLNEKELKNSRGPTIEELSKMFYTTKHRWYPVGQYHRRRKNPNPPKDR